MAQRIKGQEVECILIVNGEIKDTITDVKSLELAAKLDLLEEGYLGETTNRYDEIFKGVRGKMEVHFENKDVLDLMISIVNRARRREPGTQINIKTTLNFPNGDRPRVQITNAFFGEIPVNFGSRADYGTVSLDFAASDLRVIS